MHTFLKIKQEASAFPEDCLAEGEKQQYISDYSQHHEIYLNYDIEKYEGL